MNFFSESLRTALALIASLDPDVTVTVATSLTVSFWSSLFASAVGIPVGVAVALSRFPGRRLVLMVLNTLMALPTVVVGLLVYALLSRQGPLGELGLLFTVKAMVIGQSILALPIIANYTVSAVTSADPRILPTALTLGASPWGGKLQVLKEAKFAVMAGVVAGFGRVIAEVGVAMILGGNIRGYTRTMTTAIAMETGKGEFAFALALGIILMAVALIINVALNFFQER